MAIKGSLREASLADVCQLLSMGMKTGCLSITDRERFGRIYFDAGRITYAHVVNRRDRLGDMLVAEGVVTEAQLAEAVQEQGRDPGRRLGQIMVEKGWLDRDALQERITAQIEEAVYFLFTWSQGSFFFEVEQQPDETDFLVSINPESLLLEGARRVDEWSVISKKIPSLEHVFDVDRDRLHGAALELTPEQERILPLLDGTATVEEVADRSGLAEFDAGKALYGLLQAGFAERVGQRSPGPSAEREGDFHERLNLGLAFYSTAMLEEAEAEFRRVLEIRPKDPTARSHLARIALQRGRPRDAVQRLKALLEEQGPQHGAFVSLAYGLRLLDRSQDALLVLDEAEALRADSEIISLHRAAILAERGDWGGAGTHLVEYRRRLGQRPPSAPFYHLAGLLAASTGRLDEARATMDAGLAAFPESAPLLLLAGAIAERRGSLDEAERLYLRALDADRQLPQTYKNLGDIAYRRGLHEDALEQYRKATATAPDLGDDVFARMGNLYLKRGERDEAIRCWRRALELNPENDVVRKNLAVVGNGD
jgi:tetratricopeptide (TPR) repeat protein